MADLKKTIEIIFAGDDKVSGTIKGISSGFSDITAGVEAAAAPLAGIAEVIEKIVVGTGAMGLAFAAFSINEAKEFESASLDLIKVLDGNQEALETAQLAAEDYALTYGVSAKEQLASTALFVQAGFNLSDSLKLVKSSLDLVIAGEVDAAQANDILVRILKGFNLEASESTRIVDVLNEVSNQYATDVQKLGEGLAIISPIAKLAGLSLEEMTGFLVPTIEVFQSGTEAGNAFKTGLLRLVSDTKPVTAALNSIGISQRDANGELRTAGDILKDLTPKFGELSSSQQTFVAQEIFGIFQTGKLVAALQDYGKILDITAAAQGAAGSAAKEVEIRLAALETQINIASAAFEIAAKTFGVKFLDSAKDVVGGVIELEKALVKLAGTEAFDDLVNLATGKLKELSDFMLVVANNLPEAFGNLDFSRLINSIIDLGNELGGTFDLLFGDLDLTTVEGLSSALQTIVDGFATLVFALSGIVESFKPFISVVSEAIQSSGKLEEGIVKQFGNLLGAAQQITLMGVEVAAAFALMEGSGVSFKTIFEAVFFGVSAGVGALQVTFDIAAGIIVKLLRDLAFVANETAKVLSFGAVNFDNVVSELDNIVAAIGDNFLRNAEETQIAIDGVAAAFANTGGEAGKATSEIENASRSLGGLKTAGEGAGDKAAEDITYSAEEIKAQIDILNQFARDNGVQITVAASDSAQREFDEITSSVVTLTGKSYALVVGYEDEAVALGIQQTKEEIKKAEASPDTKLKVEASFELEKLKQDSALIQSSLEWTAKVDIAEAEASAKVLESAFNSTNNSVNSTGDVISTLFGELSRADFMDRSDIEDQIRSENELRKKTFDLQEKLTNSTISLQDAKTAAIKSGGSLVTISSDGLSPSIEAFMFEILEKIQVRVTEEAGEFLLGI